MTPSQQAKLFAKQHGMKIDSKNSVVTISKRIVHDSWFIECFDSYKDCVEFFTAAQNDYVNKGKVLPRSTCNVK